MCEDTGHTRLQQQSIKYRKKTSVGPSKNTDEKEKEKKRHLQSFLSYSQTQ